MNILRHKALLRLSQVSSRSTECGCEIKLRFYSNDSVFTSAAPNKFFKNEDNTDVKYNNEKRNNFNYSNAQHKKTINVNTKQHSNEVVDLRNTYNSKFKMNSHTMSLTTTKNRNHNNYKFTNYKSNPQPKSKNNNPSSVNKYLDMYDDDEEIDDKLMDTEYLYDSFLEEEFTKEEMEEAAKERMKKFVKPSKPKQSTFKPNYKLRDNPAYQTVLTNNNKEDDMEFGNVKKLKANQENDNTSGIQTFDQPAYHFDHTLTQFPDNDSNNQNAIDIRRKLIESSEGIIEYDLSSDEFNVDKYIRDLVSIEPPGPLEKCEEDLSDLGPGLGPTFNFASYANKSKLVQEYVKLGVKLYKVEKDLNHMRALMSVDLEEELPIYIQFLHDCGVPANLLGDVITKNPMILKEDLDDLKTRIRYLRAHDFTLENVARIVTNNPTWLTWTTKHIDERLGHFQHQFKLIGSEVRYLATKQPKLITYKFKSILENTFAVKEEMGFSDTEAKALILAKPRLWMNHRKKIVDSFDYLHNTMKLSHLMILSQPDTLTCRKCRLQNRHEFLLELKKVQYDPKKPNYISPLSVVYGSDLEFCRDVAKVSIDTYNLFLKTR